MREYPNLKDLTYTVSNNAGYEYQYQLQSHQIRELLGLPKKLPNYSGTLTQMVGDTMVIVVPRTIAKMISPKATRPHRVFAVCNYCRTEVPAGKLQQHRKGIVCKTTLLYRGEVEKYDIHNVNAHSSRVDDGKI
jgi:hypothetical protein